MPFTTTFSVAVDDKLAMTCKTCILFSIVCEMSFELHSPNNLSYRLNMSWLMEIVSLL